jgi:hypothetical protein
MVELKLYKRIRQRIGFPQREPDVNRLWVQSTYGLWVKLCSLIHTVAQKNQQGDSERTTLGISQTPIGKECPKGGCYEECCSLQVEGGGEAMAVGD